MPNAISLTLRTSIAAAAAARSLERTASMRCPRSAAAHGGHQQAQPPPSPPARPSRTPGSAARRRGPGTPARGPRSRPNRCGSGTGEPVLPPPQVVLTKPKLVDRHRRAERHDRQADAAHAQRRDGGEHAEQHGGGDADERREREADAVRPPRGARSRSRRRRRGASCTTEICPTKPVITTSDSAITVPISELISAWRKSNGRTTSATRADHRAARSPAGPAGAAAAPRAAAARSARRAPAAWPRAGTSPPR